jgi:hypothetical protein
MAPNAITIAQCPRKSTNRAVMMTVMPAWAV